MTPVSEWATRFPWLRAGTTRRTGTQCDTGPLGSDTGSGTPGSMADPGVPPLQEMLALTSGRPWRSVVRSRQVHGSLTLAHADVAEGVCVVGEADGHVTGRPGVLLTVTVADCVPVFVRRPGAQGGGAVPCGVAGDGGGGPGGGNPCHGEQLRERAGRVGRPPRAGDLRRLLRGGPGSIPVARRAASSRAAPHRSAARHSRTGRGCGRAGRVRDRERGVHSLRGRAVLLASSRGHRPTARVRRNRARGGPDVRTPGCLAEAGPAGASVLNRTETKPRSVVDHNVGTTPTGFRQKKAQP